jgi:putative acetyltransferase
MRETVRLRRADAADQDEILAFQRAAIAAIPAGAYAADVSEAWSHTPVSGLEDLLAKGRYFVAVDGSRPVGGAGWAPVEDGETAQIRGVFVHPDHAARGLGSRLVDAAEDAAVTAGYTKIVVPAALSAVGFYEQLGYAKKELDWFPLGGLRLDYAKMEKLAA